MEFLIPVIPLDKGSVILKTPFLSTAINRNNKKKTLFLTLSSMCPLQIFIIRKCCYVLFTTAITYSTMYMYILYATIPGPRVVTDAEFHIATEPNGCIEFLSIFYQNIKKKFTFKNLIRFVSL